MEILEMIAKALLEYGAIGILAAAGWALAGWMLWRDNKKKETRDKDIEAKEGIIKEKDTEIARVNKLLTEKVAEVNIKLAETVTDLQEKRISDLKEITDDYNDLATNNIQTLEKLTMALEVSNRVR